MRLFVAADLPAGVVERLARHGRELAQAGGWRAVDPGAIHITLVFLGELAEDAVEPISGALEAAWRPVGGLSLGRELRLPPRRPRVAAVELDDADGKLSALQAAVSARLATLALHTPERRRYLPHATVARRTREPEGRAAAFEADDEQFSLASVTLYVSRLSPRGARYEALARFAG